MKKVPVCVACLFLLISAFGQSYNPAAVNKKAVVLYNQAISRAQDGSLPLAAGLLQQSIALDSQYVDAYLALAAIYSQLKNHRLSVEQYEKAFAIDPVFTMPYKLAYSINAAALGDFEKALAAVNELLEKNPPKNETSLKTAQYRKRCYEFALDYKQKTAGTNYVFAPQNAGEAINTAESEYFPSLTIDGKEIVFTRKLGGFNEDFFYSEKKEQTWQKAIPIKGQVNTPLNEAAQNISQDGLWLVFTGCNRPDGMGGCDIYISYLEDNGWSEAFNLGQNFNSDQWDSQPCLSPDKKDLYFASRRFGGYGGSDIYVSHLQSNGRWSMPKNLGASINTSGDEQCPFIHADNQTLYFTSDYWPGYGDNDLFYTRKKPDNSWGEPVNLGYPINTINNEATLFITADGKTAYYASDRSDSRGGLDIYSFELRENIRPYKTLWVKGQVYDEKTNAGLPSSVQLTDLATGQLISNAQTDEQGHYLVTLPVGKDYAFNVNRKGYLFYSDSYLLGNEAPDSVYRKNIPLQPIEVNASIVLKNVFFESKKYDLNPQSQVELDKVVQLLNDNPTVKIQISGHTDNVGKPADNQQLSDSRAKTVVAYLINKRISPQRLTFKGYGETMPVADNTTEAGRATNRRTELKITAQ